MALTLLALALLTLLALLPLLAVLVRPTEERERGPAALDLHRAQLAELARERDAGRIAPDDFAAAVLEVQRRLLAADRLHEPPSRAGSKVPIIAACVLLPIGAVALYALKGHPNLPAEPMAARLAAAAPAAPADPAPADPAPADPALTDATIARARQKLAAEPDGEDARQGWILLGNTEIERGHVAEAADAWRRAVKIRFEPDLAALAAEARTRADGRIDADSRALFTRALAEGAPNAPWRAAAEQRLRQPR